MIRLVFFMLLASILLSLTVLVVLALSNKVVMKKTDQPIACLPCTKIVRNPMDLSAADPLIETLSRRLGEDDEELCCAYDSAQMSALLEMTMRRQEVDTAPLQEYNVSSFQFSPVSAHKRLYPPVNPHTTVAYRDRVLEGVSSLYYVSTC
ncbi:uncharacterized protein LOC131936087 [Physella acuta]|uniref:uncharacterized protein LOC131936087 n=1 Tax=Physella acuta TaxID=109671 RepID=UPI0027DBE6A8|nr:uncharacterized protein LOC131936087 [Physella acuta]